MRKSIILLLILFFVLSLSFFACESSDDEDSDDGGYSFLNQTLQGKIDGTSWTYVDGYAFEWSDGSLSISLYDVEGDGDGCSSFDFNSNVSVSFSIDADQTGVTVLSFGNTDSQTVTIYDGEWNNIVTAGAIDIESIGDDEISGSIDATFDANNYVNGNFTVTRCEGF